MPHAGGGLIVTTTGGYVAGTYLSTAAIGSIIATATATLGAGTAAITGAASAIIGSAGIFGTTVGATGLTGALMSAGILPSTPIVVPIALGGVAVGGTYIAYRMLQLRRKLAAARDGEEVQFTEMEASVIAGLIKRLAKRGR